MIPNSFYNPNNRDNNPSNKKVKIILQKNNTNIFRLRWLVLLTSLLKFSFINLSNPTLFYIGNYLNKTNLTSFNLTNRLLPKSLKSVYSSKYSFSNPKHSVGCTPSTTKFFINHKTNLQFIQPFKLFIKVNLFANLNLLKVHFSWQSFYISSKYSSNSYISISKIFIRWKQFYYLLTSIIFYRLKVLYFSNSFFKHEINSLNWSTNKLGYSLWRYISPFFTQKSTKIFNQGWLIFYRLSLRGYRIALVVDTLYHLKTVYYLNKFNYFTFGIVPLNYSSNTLNLAIPSSSDNFITQLFFLQFLIKIQKKGEDLRFKDYFLSWTTFL